jgi:hypothetical protein
MRMRQVAECAGCAGTLLQAGFCVLSYRQKNMVENLENTGFASQGRRYYNVFIMDETIPSLVGSGRGDKMRQPGGSRIERVFNYKYPTSISAIFRDSGAQDKLRVLSEKPVN